MLTHVMHSPLLNVFIHNPSAESEIRSHQHLQSVSPLLGLLFLPATAKFNE